MPTVLSSIAQAVDALAAWRRAHPEGRLALVPTMGALHDGHVSLVDAARSAGRADAVVVSVFVNPLQFGPNEDFDRYPRTFEADLARLDAAGVAYVFAPSVPDMYPDGLGQTRVVGGPAALVLDGAHRPGHFDGVLTVVSKLLHIVGPDVAVFGEKDAQQLFLIRRMVADLNVPVEIVGAPILRDHDGLALSSRNVYLSANERRAGLALSRSLAEAVAVVAAGGGTDAALAAGRAVLAAEPEVRVDYFEIVDASTFFPPEPGHAGDVRFLVAARVGTTRLIDNAAATLAPGVSAEH